MISAISCVFRAISSVFSAISCVFSACVVSAMGDGNCSLRWSATVKVVQESMCERVTSGGELREAHEPDS